MPRQTLSCPTLNLKKRLKLKTWQEDRREMNAHIDKVENQLRAELNKAVNDLTHCQEVRGCVSLCLCVCVLAETILLVPHRVRLSVLFPCVCVCVCVYARWPQRPRSCTGGGCFQHTDAASSQLSSSFLTCVMGHVAASASPRLSAIACV